MGFVETLDPESGTTFLFFNAPVTKSFACPMSASVALEPSRDAIESMPSALGFPERLQPSATTVRATKKQWDESDPSDDVPPVQIAATIRPSSAVNS